MSLPDSESDLSPLKRAYLALDRLQARLASIERARREPIAIIGLGCRFPGGAVDPESYWRLLAAGVDAVTEVPAERWDAAAYYDPDPEAPGKMNTRWGAFLDGIDRFDPQLFGIAPREAASLDPQQRLLLEVTWEALEHAGQAPDGLSGSKTGVFVGIVNGDYGQLSADGEDPGRIDTYYGTGNAHSMASGRLSYVFGLQGPSISIDTACSASLVAVHLACQSLRLGECELALAGGVNVILCPETTIALSKLQMMAPDGRCKSFDARADGFVRGEGCGVIVLKRLSDALAQGDRILALIRGSAVNQDGPSSGLTAPNGPAQEAVLRAALVNAGVEPADVAYVEAHGTGTSLGDPLELQALARALGPGRPAEQPLWVGSVKTNLGHLESAAGIAGLIKVVLALGHRAIPPHLHFVQPNPHLPWDRLPMAIPTRLVPWPAEGELRAGVSSFGFSGTNAHVLLEAAPVPASAPQPAAPVPERPRHLLCLSGRDERALRELAGRFAAHIDAHPEETPADLCFTANSGRAHLAHRLAVAADDTSALAAALRAVAAGEPPSGMAIGVARVDAPRVAFLFTGQGAQYVGMGRQLYETQPTFRATLDRCAALLEPHLDVPLLDLLYPPAWLATPKSRIQNPKLNSTRYTQPALFALEYALATLWGSWGIRPTVVMGHSVGELVAACVAGAMSLEDGLALVARRGRLMGELPSGGAMAAVFAPAEQVIAAVAPRRGQVAVAALNAPEQVVISGSGDAVDAVLAELSQGGVRSRRLTVSHAFHSPLMDPMLDAFERSLGDMGWHAPGIPLVSNLTGQPFDPGQTPTAAYWRRHARETVRFAEGMATLEQRGVEVFLEIGPAPTLLELGRRCLPEQGLWLPSLRPGQADWRIMLDSLARLYVAGAAVDWAGFDRDTPRRKLALPTYPFQRNRYWSADRPVAPGAGRRAAAGPTVHPLLGRRLRSALADAQYEVELDPAAVPFLADHRVLGQPILPAAAFIELAVAAARASFGPEPGPVAVEELVIHEALAFPEEQPRTVQSIVERAGDTAGTVRVFSLSEDEATGEDRWRLHATARIALQADGNPPTRVAAVASLRAACPEEVAEETHYARLAAHGLDFGPALQGLRRLWRGDSQALADVRLPAGPLAEAARYHAHPALLDACLQAIAALVPGADDPTTLYLPLSVDRLRLHEPAGLEVTCHAVLHRPEDARAELLSGDLDVFDPSGRLVAELRGLQLKRLRQGELIAGSNRATDWLYELVWEPATGEGAQRPEPQAVLASAGAQLGPLWAAEEVDHHVDLIAALNAVSVEWIHHALRQLGWAPQPDERVVAEELAGHLGVAPEHRRLFGRLLAILAGEGTLRPDGHDWAVAAMPPTATDPTARLAELRAAYPASTAPIELVGRCGARLAEALGGVVDPVELLFPGGSLDLAEQLYAAAPDARVFNRLAAAAVASWLADTPADRTLQMLEIGAGTGGTTAALLPALPADRTAYWFTDISPHFLASARRKLAAYPFVRTERLDIEQDPGGQGLPVHAFDLVVAANVLHATVDLRQTLRHAGRLLAPGGLLLLLEGTGPEPWIDITFGLTDGWWRFTDRELRPECPLLSADEWAALLGELGFGGAAVLTPPVPEAQQALILARAPEDRSEGAVAAGPAPADRWLILADRSGVGVHLAEAMGRHGVAAITVWAGDGPPELDAERWQVDPRAPEHFRQLVEAAGEGGPIRGVVHLWSLDVPLPPDDEVVALEGGQVLGTGSALHVLQALLVAGSESAAPLPRLWLVTRGGQPVATGEAPVSVAQAPLWGLGRVIGLEHPDVGCVRLDLDPQAPLADQVAALWSELQAPDVEDQVAYRAGRRHVPRLRHAHLPPEPSPLHPVRLEAAPSGVLDELALVPAVRRAPGPGEVELRVQATGLNFRDVLNALAMRQDPEPLGSECAGRILAVGSGVVGLHVGDEVLAIAPGCFATTATTRADWVLPRPPGLSAVDAATLPMAFLTAHHALSEVAGLAAGERVLIHAAAGGVGQAAVQLAQRVGAEIFATAGSPEKRALLRSMGVPQVMDSRSLGFAEEVRTLTGGRGVDVILNSLAGELIPASLSALAERGRFIELGKRDVWTPKQVARVRPHAAYTVVDLGALMAEHPERIRPMLAALLAGVGAGALRPLPTQTYPLAEVRAAFRTMAQGKHSGKLVITQEIADIPAAPRTNGRSGERASGVPPTRDDGTVLITGGLAGLGLYVGRWLVEQGVRHLVLVGRSSASSEAREAVAAMTAAGAEVRLAWADVARAEELARVLEDVTAHMPPLRGVIHSAGVLDDGVLLRQSWERFAAVMAPKVDGAWNLHVLTRGQPLDFFVLFSSAAALFGSAGQGNHAAANTFLDALAHYRRDHGLPALSINWGAWSEIGAAAERGVGERVEDQGIGTIAPDRGLELLERLLVADTAQVAVLPVDWPRYLDHRSTHGGVPAWLAGLARAATRRVDVAGRTPNGARREGTAVELARRLGGASPATRRAVLLDFVLEQAAAVLELGSAEALDPRQSLQSLGLDSLMAVELRNRLATGLPLSRPLPTTLVFDYPTVQALVDYLLAQLDGDGRTVTAAAASPGSPTDLLEAIATLSDEESERLLAEKMRSS